VQPSFKGEYRHSIDAKGRLIVPSRLRPPLAGDKVVLSYWLDGGIALWSGEGWDAIEARLLAQGRGSATARSLLRRIASSAYEDEIDSQGRIQVPPQLRQEAGIDRDVVVIGVLDHAEIWAPDKYDEMKQIALEPGVLEAAVEELTGF
jgi:MraZ protein